MSETILVVGGAYILFTYISLGVELISDRRAGLPIDLFDLIVVALAPIIVVAGALLDLFHWLKRKLVR